MPRNYVRQLKDLRSLPVPPEAIAMGRERLIMAMRSAPMPSRSSIWLSAAVFRPMLAAIVVMTVATGGGTVTAAHSALPGDRLYGIKIASEGVREHVALTSESRLMVQAERASNRLTETAKLLERQGMAGEDRDDLVRETMDLYRGHLFDMDEIAAKTYTSSSTSKDWDRAREATEQVLDLHAELMDSADVSEPNVASFLIDSVDESLLLGDDMRDVPSESSTDEDVKSERHRTERVEKINGNLKRLRFDLEDHGLKGGSQLDDQE